MLVATFGPTTGWEGREIIWDVDRFILVGHGAVPAAGVLDYDRRGQLLWAQPELRAWVVEVDRWETGGRPRGGSEAGTRSSGGGLPAWAIALIAGAVALVVIGLVAGALLIPVWRARGSTSPKTPSCASAPRPSTPPSSRTPWTTRDGTPGGDDQRAGPRPVHHDLAVQPVLRRAHGRRRRRRQLPLRHQPGRGRLQAHRLRPRRRSAGPVLRGE